MSGRMDSARRIGVMPRGIAVLGSVIHRRVWKFGGAHCICLVRLFSRNALNYRPMYSACHEMQVFYSVSGSCLGVLGIDKLASASMENLRRFLLEGSLCKLWVLTRFTMLAL
jgi:hypothetical protein